MKIFIVWDPLYEEAISAHRTEKGAHKRMAEKDEKDSCGNKRNCYWHEYDEFELEK